MVSEGIELDRVYGHKFCGPSRAAIQSGRLPIHVTVLDNPLDSVNPKDPDGGFQGIASNMADIASKLKHSGYATKAYGNWHNGVATPSHTPQGRGYDTSLHYFDAANDYYTQSYLHPCKGENTNLIDFWNTDKPANKQNNPSDCSQTHQPNNTCPNEDDILGQQAVADITAHDPSIPLFMFFASHSIHEPYEAPNTYLNKFKSVDVEVRQYYDVSVLDALDVYDVLDVAFC
jgi:arylsulfatase I/J